MKAIPPSTGFCCLEKKDSAGQRCCMSAEPLLSGGPRDTAAHYLCSAGSLLRTFSVLITKLGVVLGSVLEALFLPVFLASFVEDGSPAHFVLFMSSLLLLVLSSVVIGFLCCKAEMRYDSNPFT